MKGGCCLNSLFNENDLGAVGVILEKYENPKETLIAVLQDLQEEYGYLPRAVLEEVSAKTGIALSHLTGVASFYAQFRLNPPGKYKIMVCLGTACHVNGGERVADTVSRHLGVDEGETTPDGLFSFETVACLGCCSLSPVMMINGQVYGKLNADKVKKILDDIRKSENA